MRNYKFRAWNDLNKKWLLVYEYNVELLTHLSFQYKGQEEMIQKHFKYHDYRYC